jgi:hypothetical protein
VRTRSRRSLFLVVRQFALRRASTATPLQIRSDPAGRDTCR